MKRGDKIMYEHLNEHVKNIYHQIYNYITDYNYDNLFDDYEHDLIIQRVIVELLKSIDIDNNE